MFFYKIAVLSALIAAIHSQDVPNIQRIGNELKPSASGVDIEGAIFLINDLVLSDGVVFAFSAFFRYDTAARLQIWRPEEGVMDPAEDQFGGQKLTLLGEIRVIPSVTASREDIYIESRITEPCIRVKTGDRLGVYFEEAPGAVAYVFDANHPTALGTTVDEAVEIGNETEFNTLVFPYDFSLAAYFHADPEGYNITDDTQFVECPRGMLIPSFNPIGLSTTTAEPVTGRPGDTGEIGPVGDMGATGPMGAVGATGVGATGDMGEMGPAGEMGATGMIGDAGPQGIAGSQGEMGATGAKGEQGDTGLQGPAGPVGPYATLLPLFVTAQPVKDSEDGTDMISWVLLVWLIIVTILIVLLLIGLCCMYRRYKRDENEKQYQHQHGAEAGYGNGAYDSADSGTVKRDNGGKGGVKYSERVPSYLENEGVPPTWTSTMKSIAESTYSIDTLEDENSTKNSRANSPKGEEKFPHTGETGHMPLETNVSDSNSNTGLMGQNGDVAMEPSSPTSINSKFAI